jgi:hypothetical protein
MFTQRGNVTISARREPDGRIILGVNDVTIALLRALENAEASFAASAQDAA